MTRFYECRCAGTGHGQALGSFRRHGLCRGKGCFDIWNGVRYEMSCTVRREVTKNV